MSFWRILLLLICSNAVVISSHADRSKQKIAVIVGNSQSLHSQALLSSLTKKRFKYKLYSLKDLGSLPYREIFDTFLDSSVVRLIDQIDKSSLMSIEEAHFWVEFLSNRGSLTLFADKLSNEKQVYESELTDYVGFKVNKLGIKAKTLIGTQKDLISKGETIQIDETKKRDEIIPRTGSGIDIVYSSRDGNVTGIKQQTCNFRMSYFSFLPGEIKETKIRNNFVERAVDWNLGYALAVGMSAPEFNILLPDGTQTGIYNQYNKLNSVILLEFMATWCSNCEKQLPKMVKLKNNFEESDVSFIFVSYKEKLETIQKYLESHHEITWPVAITPDGLGALRYGVKGLPGIYILDSNRRVRFIHKGGIGSGKLKAEILKLLKQENFTKAYNFSQQ
tara:strand:- start:4522 stop:5694 length:1173 start_codon:yes stop_codon:yes gene_type:complete